MIDFYKHFKLKFVVIIFLQQSILGTYFFFQNPSFIHVPEPIGYYWYCLSDYGNVVLTQKLTIIEYFININYYRIIQLIYQWYL